MNRVELVGRLTRDPELRTSTSGLAVVRFSIAVDRRISREDRDAGKQSADFINIVAFGKQGETIARYLTKGRQIALEGRIQTGSYDAQDGTKRYTTEVVLDSFDFIGGNNDSNANSSYSAPVNAYVDNTSTVYMDAPSPETGVDISTEDPFKNFGSEVSLSDDDLPF